MKNLLRSEYFTRRSGCLKHSTFKFRQSGGGLKPNRLVKAIAITIMAVMTAVTLLTLLTGCSTPCKWPGCVSNAISGSSYCEAHLEYGEAADEAVANAGGVLDGIGDILG